MPEIIGRFIICNGKIDTPPNFEGEYILETTKNGSFTYRPIKEIVDGLTFVVWDDINPTVSVSFSNESQAVDYKNRVEKFYKKSFHMKKVFPSAEKNGKLVEE